MFSPLSDRLRAARIALVVSLLFAVSAPVLAQDAKTTDQLPDAFRGVKVYKLPTKNGQPEPNLGIYRKISYEDINFDRLRLQLALSIRAVDHPATVEHIFFQNVKVNGIPVQIDSFDQEFKLSSKDVVDVPGPLECTVNFADLDSLQPVRDLVDKDMVVVTGQSFVEVKLGALASVAAMARHVVVPVPLAEQIPAKIFEGRPVLHITATTILDNLVTPTSSAAIAMAKAHLAKLHMDESLGAKVKPALYLLLTEYQVRDPNTRAAEQFSLSGTGFLVSTDGRLVTSKRIVEPWKFDHDVEFLLEHQHMELDKTSVKIYAWPAGALVMGLDGQPDLASAMSTDHQTVQVLTSAPDETVEDDYVDPGSGKRVKLHVQAEGASDVALLRLTGSDFKPLTLPDAPAAAASSTKLVLCSYPFGITQPQATPRLLDVQVTPAANLLQMEHRLDPGESGAPLLDADGKVVAMAISANQNIPIQVVQRLIP